MELYDPDPQSTYFIKTTAKKNTNVATLHYAATAVGIKLPKYSLCHVYTMSALNVKKESSEEVKGLVSARLASQCVPSVNQATHQKMQISLM